MWGVRIVLGHLQSITTLQTLFHRLDQGLGLHIAKPIEDVNYRTRSLALLGSRTSSVETEHETHHVFGRNVDWVSVFGKWFGG